MDDVQSSQPYAPGTPEHEQPEQEQQRATSKSSKSGDTPSSHSLDGDDDVQAHRETNILQPPGTDEQQADAAASSSSPAPASSAPRRVGRAQLRSRPSKRDVVSGGTNVSPPNALASRSLGRVRAFRNQEELPASKQEFDLAVQLMVRSLSSAHVLPSNRRSSDDAVFRMFSQADPGGESGPSLLEMTPSTERWLLEELVCTDEYSSERAYVYARRKHRLESQTGARKSVADSSPEMPSARLDSLVPDAKVVRTMSTFQEFSVSRPSEDAGSLTNGDDDMHVLLTPENADWYEDVCHSFAFRTDDLVRVHHKANVRVAQPGEYILISDQDGVIPCTEDEFMSKYEAVPGERLLVRSRCNYVLAKSLGGDSFVVRLVVGCDPSAPFDSDAASKEQVVVPADVFHSHYQACDEDARRSRTLDRMFEGLFLPSNVKSLIKDTLVTATSWDFDIFKLNELSDGNTLFYLGFFFFQQFHLIKHFHIPLPVLRNFLTAVQDGYKKNPYHNALHGADVLQSTMHFVRNGLANVKFGRPSKLEYLAVVVAALVHDVGHPGLTNPFLVNAQHPLAVVYNDNSVLEQHHASTCFRILARDTCNILAHISPENQRRVRSMVIKLVLATDLSNHFTIVNEFKSKVLSSRLDLSKKTDKMMMLIIALKCADIGHPVKPLPIHLNWSERCMTEFFAQGDRERSKGMKISPFCDRFDAKIAKSQQGFLEFLVRPMITVFTDLVHFHTWIEHLNTNQAYWTNKLEQEEAQTQRSPHHILNKLPAIAIRKATGTKKTSAHRRRGTAHVGNWSPWSAQSAGDDGPKYRPMMRRAFSNADIHEERQDDERRPVLLLESLTPAARKQITDALQLSPGGTASDSKS